MSFYLVNALPCKCEVAIKPPGKASWSTCGHSIGSDSVLLKREACGIGLRFRLGAVGFQSILRYPSGPSGGLALSGPIFVGVAFDSVLPFDYLVKLASLHALISA